MALTGAARQPVNEAYTFLRDRPLGGGQYGQVFLMRSINTGEEVAAKRLQKHDRWSAQKFRERVGEEVAALQQTKHRNVIELIDHHPDPTCENYYWVVMRVSSPPIIPMIMR